MSEPRKKESYSVFVKFRRTRLTMRRGLARVEDAVALAAELRSERFHNPGDVFVVKEPGGEIVDEALVPVSGVRSTRLALEETDVIATERPSRPPASSRPPPIARLSPPPPPPEDEPSPALGEHLLRASSVAARARRAGERFVAALGQEPPPFPAEPSLLARAQQSRRRARLLHGETSRAARAFEELLGRLGRRWASRE